jgi:hypothetical protein
MKILLAPDSFKGSLSAVQVCKALRVGVERVRPDADCVALPLADGGEYPALYRRFAALIARGQTDCDLAPLELVAKALACAETTVVPPFDF